MADTSSSAPRLRFRVLLGAGAAIGPGKADLLEAIAAAGSIAAAARTMRMSYKRAWQLVDELNHYFVEPLVLTSKGGGAGGGAKLSDTGQKVLAGYRRIERSAHRSAAKELGVLDSLRR